MRHLKPRRITLMYPDGTQKQQYVLLLGESCSTDYVVMSRKQFKSLAIWIKDLRPSATARINGFLAWLNKLNRQVGNNVKQNKDSRFRNVG